MWDITLYLKVLTYGGAIRSLTVPGRDGEAAADVVLGFDDMDGYKVMLLLLLLLLRMLLVLLQLVMVLVALLLHAAANLCC